MTATAWLNALCYEFGLWGVQQWPSIAFQPWFKLMMANCRPDWVQWKTTIVMEAVDRQAKELVQQWEQDHRVDTAVKLAEKAQELFPDATITPLPNTGVPSVMIEYAPSANASEAVKALGGEMRITWTLK